MRELRQCQQINQNQQTPNKAAESATTHLSKLGGRAWPGLEERTMGGSMQEDPPKSNNGPVGLMDKASASGAGDSRFESWAGHLPERNKYQK